jgi:hypothetical protein
MDNVARSNATGSKDQLLPAYHSTKKNKLPMGNRMPKSEYKQKFETMSDDYVMA